MIGCHEGGDLRIPLRVVVFSRMCQQRQQGKQEQDPSLHRSTSGSVEPRGYRGQADSETESTIAIWLELSQPTAPMPSMPMDQALILAVPVFLLTCATASCGCRLS